MEQPKLKNAYEKIVNYVCTVMQALHFLLNNPSPSKEVCFCLPWVVSTVRIYNSQGRYRRRGRRDTADV